MRNLKKFLALILAMMMTFSLMATVNASSFEDDDDITDDYAEAVDVLTGLKVIKGYENADKTFDFKPKNNITRGEVAAILYRIVTGDVKDASIHLYKHESEFTDVYATDWYAPYVNFCSNNGLVKGVGDNRFNPNGNITGYEALVMILRAIGYNNPSEFTSSDWKFKASGYGSRLGLTANIPAGSLGGAATRESVAEIMFQGLLAPTVSYSPLTMYTENLLVDASEVNAAPIANGDGVLYANDVKSNLMYETFQIVGKRTILTDDNYGRPVTQWVKDATDDTVDNGGKYIVNPQKKAETTAAIGDGVKGNESAATNKVAAGATYVPSSTPAATYANLDAGTSTYTKVASKIDKTALSITMTPVKTYTDVVDECTLSKDINADRAIPAANVTEWLNGTLFATRTASLDALHTREATVNAPGRTLEVYRTDTDTTSDTFVFVYFDTLMGVVDKIIPRTFDTNKHVMSDAELHVKINDNVTVVDTDDESDFEDYKKGDLVLLTTWGGKRWSTAVKSTGKDLIEADRTTYDSVTVAAKIQNVIPQKKTSFLWYDGTDNNGAGTGSQHWAVDVIGKATTETFTIQSTVGARMVKSGVVSTDGKTYPGNVVYLANEVVYKGDTTGNAPEYYNLFNRTPGTSSPDAFNGETTVPDDYRVPMINEKIGKTVTAVLDENGYVVGMTEEAATSDIGVITGMDSVRVGTGKYAVEADMFMMDGSTKTVRFLDNDPASAYTHGGGTYDANPNNNTKGDPDGTNGVDKNNNPIVDYFKSATEADKSFDSTALATEVRNLKAAVNVLVKIEPYTLDGATYYKVVETNAGKNTNFAQAYPTAADKVETGAANMLNNAANGVNYKAKPTAADDNVDNNTKFIVAELDYRYNQGGGSNQGGYEAMIRTAYKGFKSIPTITGNNNDEDGNGSPDAALDKDNADILTQRIGNNVYICPNTADTNTTLVYTMSNKQTVAVDETYLVLATVATYADHSTYKVLKDGEETTLDVSNANTGTGIAPNKLFEDTLSPANAAEYGQLVVVTGKNTKGYVTAAQYLKDVAGLGGSRTIAETKGVYFDDTGVIAIADDVKDNNTTGKDTLVKADADHFLTVADNCSVQIVNLLTGAVTPASLTSVMQYEKANSGDADGHAFVYELDNLGYVSHIYILD